MNDQTKTEQNQIEYAKVLHDLLHTAPTDLLKLRDIVQARPPNWAPTSNAPYYNERYGKQAKQIIDRLLGDRTKDIILDAKIHRIAVNTLKAQFNQGWQWLCNLSPDPEARDFYTKIREASIVTTMVVGPRIRIYIKSEDSQELIASMETVASFNVMAWRDEFESWIGKENKLDGEIYEVVDLKLPPEQIEWAVNSLAGMENYHILSNKANLFKVAYLVMNK